LLTKDYPVDKGDILLNGERVTKLRPDQIARKGVGRSYQITSVLRELTFFENVWLAAYRAEKDGYLGAWQNYMDHKQTQIETNRILSEFGLEKFSNRKAGEVSYGDQRLLEFAVTLATRPKILLLDEPTAGLSQRETDRIKTFIMSIKSKFTIVMIEHKMNVVMDISDEISVMNRGEIIAFGTPEEISRDEAVRSAYFGL
jgi:branched-chain amino acid transport system ATP-binding protein